MNKLLTAIVITAISTTVLSGCSTTIEEQETNSNTAINQEKSDKQPENIALNESFKVNESNLAFDFTGATPFLEENGYTVSNDFEYIFASKNSCSVRSGISEYEKADLPHVYENQKPASDHVSALNGNILNQWVIESQISPDVKVAYYVAEYESEQERLNQYGYAAGRTFYALNNDANVGIKLEMKVEVSCENENDKPNADVINEIIKNTTISDVDKNERLQEIADEEAEKLLNNAIDENGNIIEAVPPLEEGAVLQ